MECINKPEQISSDTAAKIELEVGKISRLSAGSAMVDIERKTRDLFRIIPQADKVYLEQMMFFSYCTNLRDDKIRSEADKARDLEKWAYQVRSGLAASGQGVRGTVAPSTPQRATPVTIAELVYAPNAYKAPNDAAIAGFESLLDVRFDANGLVQAYAFNYSFPEVGREKLFVGLDMPLVREWQNLSRFEAIELTLIANRGARFSLMSGDSAGKQDYFPITGTGARQKISVRIDKLFRNGNAASVTNLYIIVSSDNQPIHGSSQIQVLDLRLVRR